MSNENAELRLLLQRTYGRIKNVDDPRACRAAGEIRSALVRIDGAGVGKIGNAASDAKHLK